MGVQGGDRASGEGEGDGVGGRNGHPGRSEGVEEKKVG